MKQFVPLKIIDNHPGKVMPAAKDGVDILEDPDWKRETFLGDQARNTDQFFIAMQHYKSAIILARENVSASRQHSSLPATVVPAVVISYLNLAKLWIDQGRKNGQKNSLIECFDYLVDQFNIPGISIALRNQLCRGIGKIFTELTVCLQELEDVQTLAEKRNVLMDL